MAGDRLERFQNSFNTATELNRSFNSATGLAQTMSQSQQVNTGETTSTTASSSTGSSGSVCSTKK